VRMKDTTLAKVRRVLAAWKQSATVSEAFGKVLAGTSVGQRLIETYKRDLHRHEKKQRLPWIAGVAGELGIKGPEFPEELVSAARGYGVDLQAFWPYYLERYLAECAETGNPPEFAPYFGQGSVVLDFPDGVGGTMPVAVAWVTPYGSPAKARECFDEAIAKMLDTKDAGVEPKTVDDLARIVLMESFGMKATEIAWEFLAERCPESAGLSDEMREERFADEHRREIDRLRQVRNRGFDRVTQIVPSLSRIPPEH
jgi:hypothetical protein